MDDTDSQYLIVTRGNERIRIPVDVDEIDTKLPTRKFLLAEKQRDAKIAEIVKAEKLMTKLPLPVVKFVERVRGNYYLARRITMKNKLYQGLSQTDFNEECSSLYWSMFSNTIKLTANELEKGLPEYLGFVTNGMKVYEHDPRYMSNSRVSDILSHVDPSSEFYLDTLEKLAYDKHSYLYQEYDKLVDMIISDERLSMKTRCQPTHILMAEFAVVSDTMKSFMASLTDREMIDYVIPLIITFCHLRASFKKLIPRKLFLMLTPGAQNFFVHLMLAIKKLVNNLTEVDEYYKIVNPNEWINEDYTPKVKLTNDYQNLLNLITDRFDFVSYKPYVTPHYHPLTDTPLTPDMIDNFIECVMETMTYRTSPSFSIMKMVTDLN